MVAGKKEDGKGQRRRVWMSLFGQGEGLVGTKEDQMFRRSLRSSL